MRVTADCHPAFPASFGEVTGPGNQKSRYGRAGLLTKPSTRLIFWRGEIPIAVMPASCRYPARSSPWSRKTLLAAQARGGLDSGSRPEW